jgi:nodulation protein E
MRRVVVTGLGVISPVGHDPESFWSALIAGRSGIAALAAFECDERRTRVAAEVKGFEPTQHFSRDQLATLDRFSQFALVAARQAVASAGFVVDEELSLATGVFVGSGAGGINTYEETARRAFADGAKRVHPLTVPKFMVNAAASQISIHLGLRGPIISPATACASSNNAIGLGLQMVRSGALEAAIVGGSEACLTPLTVRSWEALRVMADDTCRPFSKGRRGMVLGEGAGMLLIESLAHAQRRGAPIRAELAGIGLSADASDLVHPAQDGAERALRAALSDARLDPEDVDYINAHGTGTAANDVVETRALRAVFGAHADRLLVSATKSMVGHALGGAGALEAVATVLSLERGIAHPTANYLEPDPACDLEVLADGAREARLRAALSSSFAFGGINAVLAFRKAP